MTAPVRVDLSAGFVASLATDDAAHTSYDVALARLVSEGIVGRIFAGDATLWGEAAEAEARVRLGWTDVAPNARELLPAIEALRQTFERDGVDRYVLCGMGGSSLGPAVIARWAGCELTMLETTDPTSVQRVIGSDLARTAVIASSKSGSTVETLSHLATLEAAFAQQGINGPSRVVVVTDPGSKFELDSRAAGRHVVLADPNVGGRFSVLTAFGLVPGGLIGADVAALVRDADSVRAELSSDSPENPAIQLAAAMYASLPERFVLAIEEAADAAWGIGSWVEQLVAESTGKQGHGVLPISLPNGAPEFELKPACAITVGVCETECDSHIVHDLTIYGSLGAQFLLWEVATAALGSLMHVDPFNQPDVESAKVAAREALEELRGERRGLTVSEHGTFAVAATPAAIGDQPILDVTDVSRVLREITPADGYLAIQAYVDPQGALRAPLEQLRHDLAHALRVPVSLGFGPTYLHSVGQLHKGGPNRGAFLQFSDPGPIDLPIAGAGSSFAALIGAQARGDRGVLAKRGRQVLALRLASGDPSVVEQLSEELTK